MSGAEALAESYAPRYDAAGAVIGLMRIDYGHPGNPGDVLRFNPDDPDGWHFDRTRRAGEFALYDEYNPRRTILFNPDGSVWVGCLTFSTNGHTCITRAPAPAPARQFFLNNVTNEGYIVRGCTEFAPNGTCLTPNVPRFDDGEDALFGDLGNDWLVGGTGRDDMYGGYGNDLLSADDDLATNGQLNDQPDTHPSYEDRAFGGAGRDVLIANTGGDRLIDWVGEFNSYLVPFAPFGMATVSRTMQPQLAEFLYALSESDGVDMTRQPDTGNLPIFRNGEPEGELGVVRQQDFDWHDQTGAPADPQAGNLPGGHRDVLRTASFNDGQLQGFAVDSGTWQVASGALQVGAASLGGDAAAVFNVPDYLPLYYEIQASISVIKPTAGWKANAYVMFDYQGPASFKFAGIDISVNKLVMGVRDASGWRVLAQTPFQARTDTVYNMLLSVNGLVATVVVNNTASLAFTFPPTIIEGHRHALNYGFVGFGSDNSRGSLDNATVQVLPAATTSERSETFAVGAGAFASASGTWSAAGGRYDGAGGLSLLGLTKLGRVPIGVRK